MINPFVKVISDNQIFLQITRVITKRTHATDVIQILILVRTITLGFFFEDG